MESMYLSVLVLYRPKINSKLTSSCQRGMPIDKILVMRNSYIKQCKRIQEAEVKWAQQRMMEVSSRTEVLIREHQGLQHMSKPCQTPKVMVETQDATIHTDHEAHLTKGHREAKAPKRVTKAAEFFHKRHLRRSLLAIL